MPSSPWEAVLLQSCHSVVLREAASHGVAAGGCQGPITGRGLTKKTNDLLEIEGKASLFSHSFVWAFSYSATDYAITLRILGKRTPGGYGTSILFFLMLIQYKQQINKSRITRVTFKTYGIQVWVFLTALSLYHLIFLFLLSLLPFDNHDFFWMLFVCFLSA